MRPALIQKLTKSLQKLFWVYLTNNFVITNIREIRMVAAAIDCTFIPITLDNYCRVLDFRDESRVREYGVKLANNELGFFAGYAGKMVGSIWATINTTNAPLIARTFMRLMPNEGLIHDIVTGAEVRGRGIGPFMLGNIAARLFEQYGVRRIIIDVSTRNKPSLRMMQKSGLRIKEKVLYVSALGTLLLEKQLKLKSSPDLRGS